jgi:hypothetical protein
VRERLVGHVQLVAIHSARLLAKAGPPVSGSADEHACPSDP